MRTLKVISEYDFEMVEQQSVKPYNNYRNNNKNSKKKKKKKLLLIKYFSYKTLIENCSPLPLKTVKSHKRWLFFLWQINEKKKMTHMTTPLQIFFEENVKNLAVFFL